jgi:hypothetical protein
LCLFLLDDAVFHRSARLSVERLRTRSPQRLLPSLAREAPELRRGAPKRLWREGGALRSVAIAIFGIITVPVSLMMFAGSIGVGFAPPLVSEAAEFIAPFRSVNAYGLFAVMTTTRDEIVIEGSNDGERWRAYEFPFKPGDLNRTPPWAAPHQPRLDWQMWFAALTPYADARWFHNFCLRLLEGSPHVLALMAFDPFPDAPPKYVRGVLYRYHYGRSQWWTRERVGEYSPVLSR